MWTLAFCCLILFVLCIEICGVQGKVRFQESTANEKTVWSKWISSPAKWINHGDRYGLPQTWADLVVIPRRSLRPLFPWAFRRLSRKCFRRIYTKLLHFIHTFCCKYKLNSYLVCSQQCLFWDMARHGWWFRVCISKLKFCVLDFGTMFCVRVNFHVKNQHVCVLSKKGQSSVLQTSNRFITCLFNIDHNMCVFP
jgi:hypothetical protein